MDKYQQLSKHLSQSVSQSHAFLRSVPLVTPLGACGWEAETPPDVFKDALLKQDAEMAFDFVSVCVSVMAHVVRCVIRVLVVAMETFLAIVFQCRSLEGRS